METKLITLRFDYGYDWIDKALYNRIKIFFNVSKVWITNDLKLNMNLIFVDKGTDWNEKFIQRATQKIEGFVNEFKKR